MWLLWAENMMMGTIRTPARMSPKNMVKSKMIKKLKIEGTMVSPVFMRVWQNLHLMLIGLGY